MWKVDLLDRFLLCLCVWREARGEPEVGKQCVAQVILNRVSDPRWPNTIRDVILQPKQFSAFNANDPNAVMFPKHDNSWQGCVDSVDVVLLSPLRITSANHYCVKTLNPPWRDDSKLTQTEGAHAFFTL